MGTSHRPFGWSAMPTPPTRTAVNHVQKEADTVLKLIYFMTNGTLCIYFNIEPTQHHQEHQLLVKTANLFEKFG